MPWYSSVLLLALCATICAAEPNAEEAAVVDKTLEVKEEGFTITYNKRMFYFSISEKSNKNRKNWYQANEACRKLGGTLASIQTENENLFIKTTTARFPNWPFWIGLYNPSDSLESESAEMAKSYKWMDGSEMGFGSVAGVYPWSLENPNLAKESCVYMSKEGKWKSIKATENCYLLELPFICNVEKDPQDPYSSAMSLRSGTSFIAISVLTLLSIFYCN